MNTPCKNIFTGQRGYSEAGHPPPLFFFLFTNINFSIIHALPISSMHCESSLRMRPGERNLLFMSSRFAAVVTEYQRWIRFQGAPWQRKPKENRGGDKTRTGAIEHLHQSRVRDVFYGYLQGLHN